MVIKRAMPRQNEAVNEIWICDKGRFGYHFAESETRLTQPLIRENGELVPRSPGKMHWIVQPKNCAHLVSTLFPWPAADWQMKTCTV